MKQGGFFLVEKIILDNGVRIVTEHMPSMRSLSIGIWVGAGSRYETVENRGISHFLEHMFFKGTTSRTATEIAESFDKIGGQVNAFTSKEYTCFYARVLDQHASVALDILADMFFHSTFQKEEFKKEQNVILEEIKMVEDTPDDIIHDMLGEAYFGSHALGRPILGTKESVLSFTPEHLLRYKEQFYTADRIVISLAGNISEKVIEAIKEKFGHVTTFSSSVSLTRPKISTNKIVREKDTEQAHVCFGFPGLPLGHDDMYALTLLNNALGGSMSSRLFQDIREESGLAYSVFSYHLSFQDTGLLTIYAGTALEQVDELVEKTMQSLNKLRKEGMTNKELENGKEQLKGSFMLNLESTNSRMNRNGKNELLQNKHFTLDEVMEHIDRVTLEDIDRIAQYIIREDYAFSLISREGTLPSSVTTHSSSF